MEVAVKTLNPEAPDSSETKFLREAAIMGQFLHPNVVKLLGVVTVGEPVGNMNFRSLASFFLDSTEPIMMLMSLSCSNYCRFGDCQITIFSLFQLVPTY